jgi:PhzF family phenazine biosynthesis protein
MQLEFHQVDAFSDRPFSGNPAMVYRLDAWLAEELMQKIAAEHNLAETAFVVREGQGWHIRWFTPTTEVPLCGHATLASAYVLFEVYKEPAERLDFISKSGPLSVSREGERLWLDFPAIVPRELGVTLEVERALGIAVVDVLGSNELFVVLESEQAVLDCSPTW